MGEPERLPPGVRRMAVARWIILGLAAAMAVPSWWLYAVGRL